MDETPSLTDAVREAVSEWCADNAGGFPTSFVLALDYVNSDGEQCLLVADMPGQKTRFSLGLVAELEECYRSECGMSWLAVHEANFEEDE